MAKLLQNCILSFALRLAILISFSCFAQAQKHYSDVHPPISDKEKLYNFVTVYAAQWVYYLVVHKNEIEKYGSFNNWISYPIDPHYDRDSFEYNLYRHTLAGQYYYLFYRSRDYSEQNAFIWSAISSFAFEFTIETVTERPSYQDLYQTPVYGTVLGVGVERLSAFLHESDTRIGHFFGYLLNPFTLIPPTNHFIGAFSFQSKNEIALQLVWMYQ